LFPILDFFDVYFFRYSFVSDHFQYLASMGPLALVGAVVWMACERFKNAPRLAFPSAVLLMLGALTFHQTAKYLDAISLYRATLSANPRCWMADYNLGIALKERGQLDDAITHYRRAIAIRADYADAHFNLARLLLEKGQVDEALAHYQRAIEIRPSDADAHNNYGSALRELGQIDNAKREYKIALALQPNYVEARLNLATVLLQSGQTSEAIAQLEEAKRFQPTDPIVHTNLGNALMKNGRGREAAAEFNQALQLAPDAIGAMNSLAWLLATAADVTVRDGARAVELAERADEITLHADPVILHSLAAAYAEAGRFEDALVTARRGMKLANQNGKTAVYNAFKDELPLYELGLPYHQATVHQR
jgi:tetratricopeptide (TPR) repeat protein